MENEQCLFCKIVSGKIPASKFWENDDYIAILDLFPNTKGVTLVISKKHIPSDFLKQGSEVLHGAIDAAKKTADVLTKALTPSRVALVTEGVFVDHLHLKLYPLHNEEAHKGLLTTERVFYESYPGFVTTVTGPEWSREQLSKLAEEIRRYSDSK